MVTRSVIVRSTPEGAPLASDFQIAETSLPELGEGAVLIDVAALSLDPYLRSLLSPAGHLDDPAVGPGQVMPGRSIGTVIESRAASLPVGTQVLAETGWRERAVVDAAAATVVDLPAGIAPSAALGILGMPGLTAYAAVTRHLDPQAGQTVVISSATGGVGALAGQLVTRSGARAVAVVGTRAKATIATEQLGYAAAVVRGEPGWIDALKAACPDRIDGYLHMGDQETLDGIVEWLAVGARVSLIGLMDQTNGAAPTRIRAGALMAARATTYGMVVYDHTDLAAEHRERVGRLLLGGAVSAHEEHFLGLENAGEAFAALMSGRTSGKVVVDLTSAGSTPHKE